jgi:hypothetical protein
MPGMAHWSCSGPPEAFSPPFSPLCPWIRGPFPTIEFTVTPSSSLPNSSDPGTTLAHAYLNSGDLTATEKSSAARNRLPLPGLIPSVRFRSNGPDRGYRFAHARLMPWPACQRCPQLSVPPGLIPSVRFRSHGPDRGIPLRAHAP